MSTTHQGERRSKVGSSAPWTGKGSPPQWDLPEGKAYQHVVSGHGADRLHPKNQPKILDRMRNTHQAQGIWRDNNLFVEAEKLAPPHQGEYIIEMGKDVGDVFELDGTVTKAVTRAFVRRAADGQLVSAYPISNKFRF